MKLDVRGPQALQVLPMAMLLLSVRTQLTGLQSLTLELSQSWDGARSSWAELAGMTQLTKLHITSINQVCTVLLAIITACLAELVPNAGQGWLILLPVLVFCLVYVDGAMSAQLLLLCLQSKCRCLFMTCCPQDNPAVQTSGIRCQPS
jgi:hypothetical protein